MKALKVFRYAALLATTAALALLGTAAPAQDVVINGDFEAGSTGWTILDLGASTGLSTIDFDFTGDLPTGGSGQCLRFQSATDQGGAVYQSFTATAGETYYLFFRSKDLASGAAGAWVEAFVSDVAPTPGSDYTSNKMSVFNTWNCDDWDGSNLSACEYRRLAFTIPANGTYYLVIKAGACCGQTGDVVIDDVSLSVASVGSNLLTNGEFGDGSGWTEFNQTTAGGETIVFDYTATTDVPSGASSPALNVTQSGGFRNGGIYQPVNVVAGTTYILSGYTKDNGSIDSWGEFYLVDTQPTDGNDVSGTNFYAYSTYATCGGWNSAIGVNCSNGNYEAPSVTADITGTLYFVLKSGCNNTLDMSFDELALREVTPPAGTSVAEWMNY